MKSKPSIFTADVVSLGRVTIPKPLRNLYSIREGCQVELEIRAVEHKPNAKKKVSP